MENPEGLETPQNTIFENSEVEGKLKKLKSG